MTTDNNGMACTGGMADNPFASLAQGLAAGLACVWFGGCAGSFVLSGSEKVTAPFLDPAMSMQTAKDTVAIDKTTKAELIGALGPATVVKFDSGFEVWIYRARSADKTAALAEFVVLVAPSGVVKKTRIRPSYITRAQ